MMASGENRRMTYPHHLAAQSWAFLTASGIIKTRRKAALTPKRRAATHGHETADEEYSKTALDCACCLYRAAKMFSFFDMSRDHYLIKAVDIHST